MSKNWLSEMVQGQEENLRDRRIADADLQQKKLRGRLGYSHIDAQSFWKESTSDERSAECSDTCSGLCLELEEDFGTEILLEQGRNGGSYSFFDSRMKKKAKEDRPKKKPLKKEGKKKKKKRKKYLEAAQEILSDALMENDVKTGTVMAEVMKYATTVVLAEEQIWLYNED